MTPSCSLVCYIPQKINHKILGFTPKYFLMLFFPLYQYQPHHLFIAQWINPPSQCPYLQTFMPLFIQPLKLNHLKYNYKLPWLKSVIDSSLLTIYIQTPCLAYACLFKTIQRFVTEIKSVSFTNTDKALQVSFFCISSILCLWLNL